MSANKKILLVGTGKFGNHIGKNLKNYLSSSSLYFTNRTDKKALDLAKECDGRICSLQKFSDGSK